MEVCPKTQYGTVSGGRVDHRSESSSSLRILLVGRSSCGKSATGNSILCQYVFESRLSPQTVTRRCQEATGTWDGRNILVVDTPPIFEAKAQDQEMYEDIRDCYRLLAPGPHVLLLVTQLDHFTAQDTMALRRVKEVFGAEAVRHMVVLFTHKEDLKNESLAYYVVHSDNLSLQSLVQECGGRYCGFNNRATGQEQRAQLEDLMAVVRGLEMDHNGAFYSNDLFSAAARFNRGGVGAESGEFLAQVRAHVEKQKRDLKETEGHWIYKVLRTGKKWVFSLIGLCASIMTGILIVLAVLINLGIAHGH